MTAPVGRSAGRILHVLTRMRQAGTERNVLHFIEWERSAGYDVELAVGADSTFVPKDIPSHRLTWLVRAVNPFKDAIALRELRILVARGQYDLVHTHQSKAGILGRLAAFGRTRRLIHTVHMASFGPEYGPASSTLFRLAEKRCANSTDFIVFVGSELRDRYLEAGIYPRESNLIIRSPVGVEQLLATRGWSNDRRADERHSTGIVGGGRLLLAIGDLSRRKRYPLMLQRLARVLSTNDVRLAIAGEGDQRATIDRAARGLGVADRVHLLGYVPDVIGLIAAADLLVHTSAVEGVPQVVIQALAAGKSVVATDGLGLREIRRAPITIVPRSGSGLAGAVEFHLRNGSIPLDAEELRPWSTHGIDAEIAALHAQL